MFSHVVIFWTDPAQPLAVEELLAGLETLKAIPGALSFHAGKMVTSPRPVVDQTYQVALNIVFANKKALDEYQVHSIHVKFVTEVLKRVTQRILVYDFE